MISRRLIISALFIFVPLAISAQSLAVTSLSKLAFGEEIFPGSSKQISRTEAAAASFEITGEAGQEIHIIFELPADLTNQDSETLDVSFSSTDAGYHNSQTEQANATAFDPTNGLIITLDAEGSLYLWLGGTVHPHSNQAGGYYSADITANASYTTN